MGGRGALRTLRVSVLAALAAATLVLASPGAALGRARYVALGDSYSSGTGTGNYFDRQCLRSEQAYPAVVASARGDLDLVFEACSGATTDDLLREQLDGLTADTRWVTVTIGGNDIGFADIVVACASASLAGNCEEEIAEGERKAREELPAKLDRTYRAIRQRAPHARVLVLGYPRLFQDRGRPPNCTGGALFTPERIERLNRGAEMLRDLIRSRVEAAGPGFYFLDAIPVFEGHEVCSPNPRINGVMTEIVSSYHPNRFGHFSGYGRMVLDAMERIPRAERTASPSGGQGLDGRNGGGTVRALRRCPVAARAAFTGAGIGRFQLGTAARTLERLVGAPQARSRAVWTWCVRGGGAVTVHLRGGRVIAVFSNARGHSYRGLAVGRPVTAATRRRLGLARRGQHRRERRASTASARSPLPAPAAAARVSAALAPRARRARQRARDRPRGTARQRPWLLVGSSVQPPPRPSPAPPTARLRREAAAARERPHRVAARAARRGGDGSSPPGRAHTRAPRPDRRVLGAERRQGAPWRRQVAAEACPRPRSGRRQGSGRSTPGFKTPRGSNARLIARISSISRSLRTRWR